MNARILSTSQSVVTTVTVTLFVAFWLLTCIPAVDAEVYSWTDESGNINFTDTPETIPKKYQKKVGVSDDTTSRNWEYLASEYGTNYYYDASNVTYTNRNRYKIMIKESYAASGREEYETLIMFDCARLLYKPLQSVKVFNQQRSPADSRNIGEDASAGYRDGYQHLTYPYQILAKMICRDSQQ